MKRKGRACKPGEDDLSARATQRSCSGVSAWAEQLLRRLPRRRGLVTGIHVYAKAYVAAQEKI